MRNSSIPSRTLTTTQKSVRFAQDLKEKDLSVDLKSNTNSSLIINNNNDQDLTPSKTPIKSSRIVNLDNEIRSAKSARENSKMNENKKFENYHNKPTEGSLIESLNNQIQEVFVKLDERISNTLQDKESNFINAYKTVINSARNEIKELANSTKKAQIIPKSEDLSDIESLKKELDFFRKQSMFYSKKLLTTEKKLSLLKSHTNYLNYELKQEHLSLLSELKQKKVLESKIEEIYSNNSGDGTSDKNHLNALGSNDLTRRKSIDNELYLVHNHSKKNKDYIGLIDRRISSGLDKPTNYSHHSSNTIKEYDNQTEPSSKIKTNLSALDISQSYSGEHESRYSLKNIELSLFQDNLTNILKPYIANMKVIDEIAKKVVLLMKNVIQHKNKKLAKLYKTVDVLSKQKHEMMKHQSLHTIREEIQEIFLDCLRQYQHEIETKINHEKLPDHIDDTANNFSSNTSQEHVSAETTYSPKNSANFFDMPIPAKIKIMESFFANSKINEILKSLCHQTPKLDFLQAASIDRTSPKKYSVETESNFEEIQYLKSPSYVGGSNNHQVPKLPNIASATAQPVQYYNLDYGNYSPYSSFNSINKFSHAIQQTKQQKDLITIRKDDNNDGFYTTSANPLSQSVYSLINHDDNITNKRITMKNPATIPGDQSTTSFINTSLPDESFLIENQYPINSSKRRSSTNGRDRPELRGRSPNIMKVDFVPNFKGGLKFKQDFTKKIVVNNGKLMLMRPTVE